MNGLIDLDGVFGLNFGDDVFELRDAGFDFFNAGVSVDNIIGGLESG